jgi:hypothetical protein
MLSCGAVQSGKLQSSFHKNPFYAFIVCSTPTANGSDYIYLNVKIIHE